MLMDLETQRIRSCGTWQVRACERKTWHPSPRGREAQEPGAAPPHGPPTFDRGWGGILFDQMLGVQCPQHCTIAPLNPKPSDQKVQSGVEANLLKLQLRRGKAPGETPGLLWCNLDFKRSGFMQVWTLVLIKRSWFMQVWALVLRRPRNTCVSMLEHTRTSKSQELKSRSPKPSRYPAMRGSSYS